MSETSELPSTRTWDGAAAAPATNRARQFEADWKAATGRKPKPDPTAYLPDSPSERPAVLLALLRAELGLRYDAGEHPRVEAYRESYPQLDEDGLVALIYEDFCLREEAGDAPVPVEYEERFPDLTARLRRVFDIHDLVGSGQSISLGASSLPQVAFPEVGQTIAGFHLRAELGRGAFARVFLAEERQLADRPVALKVARTGSREPQTLARLQHTHIVPVHSYRTDPTTGLHLLCMPFFGRITLERLLAEPALRTACTGGDLLAVLNRLDTAGPAEAIPSRGHFARLPFDRAVSWWGARMAEALAHAHDRGVMHRDVKPSNVLITSDGLPMLLDFNLAREPWDDDGGTQAAGSLGGTLAYMSPEHLDAIAEGRDDRVDGRSDLYSLGVLLFETLTGSRPFPPLGNASSVIDALRNAAAERRRAVPEIRLTHPEIPVALESVVLRCLSPDPADRHADAASLAADLQAVADEHPLPFTREPLSSRGRRWVSRHRLGLSLTVPLMICGSLLVVSARQAQEDQTRLTASVNRLVEEGEALEAAGRPDGASAKYEAAVKFASDQPYYQAQPALFEAYNRANSRRLQTQIASKTRDNLDKFRRDADALKSRLLDSSGPDSAVRIGSEIDRVLEPFLQLADRPDWATRVLPPSFSPDQAAELEATLDELLMRRVMLLRPEVEPEAERLAELCRKGRRMTRYPGAWAAISGLKAGRGPGASGVDSSECTTPGGCVAWGIVAEAKGDDAGAIELLRQASRLAPGDFSLHRQFAGLLARRDRLDEALRQVDLALAARPESPAAWEQRARVQQSLGHWDEAREDFKKARELSTRETPH